MIKITIENDVLKSTSEAQKEPMLYEYITTIKNLLLCMGFSEDEISEYIDIVKLNDSSARV